MMCNLIHAKSASGLCDERERERERERESRCKTKREQRSCLVARDRENVEAVVGRFAYWTAGLGSVSPVTSDRSFVTLDVN